MLFIAHARISSPRILRGISFSLLSIVGHIFHSHEYSARVHAVVPKTHNPNYSLKRTISTDCFELYIFIKWGTLTTPSYSVTIFSVSGVYSGIMDEPSYAYSLFGLYFFHHFLRNDGYTCWYSSLDPSSYCPNRGHKIFEPILLPS